MQSTDAGREDVLQSLVEDLYKTRASKLKKKYERIEAVESSKLPPVGLYNNESPRELR